MQQRRRGLVLGGGGVLGAAWMSGALSALEEETGFEPRAADVIVGTSAGSVLAALIGAGLSTADLRTHQLTGTLDSGPLAEVAWDYDHDAGASRPPLPRPAPGSLGLVARNVHRLHRMPPTAVLTAFVPRGRGSLDRVSALAAALKGEDGWSPHPACWVVAMDYVTGRRVVFGREGAPEAPLSLAVPASCAIPGWYSPVEIAGHPYVDGGACSPTSADLLAGLGLDEVVILAPTVSFALDSPSAVLTRLERRWRRRVTRRCLHEARKLLAAGTDVTVIGPGPEDLEQIGGNVMDAARRRAVLLTAERTTRLALRHPQVGLDEQALDEQVGLDEQALDGPGFGEHGLAS
ncbi:MAG: patatin-like phospholipase family protein [Actinomycetes bacterium]